MSSAKYVKEERKHGVKISRSDKLGATLFGLKRSKEKRRRIRELERT